MSEMAIPQIIRNPIWSDRAIRHYLDCWISLLTNELLDYVLGTLMDVEL